MPSDPNQDNTYRVKLVSQRTANAGSAGREVVIFDASPDLSESRSINYSSIDPVHMPGQIYVYKNVQARTFSLTARLISRTSEEAQRNLNYLWIIRGWTMPRFGFNSQAEGDAARAAREEALRDPESSERIFREFESSRASAGVGTSQLGAPPEVLLLSAYSANKGTVAEHINRVPVVIQSLTIPYPTDVDYIKTTTDVPMPTIMNIDISLLEAHSPREYEMFSLDHYKKGILPNF